MKSVIIVGALGILLFCGFMFVVGGGDTDNFKGLGTEAGSVVTEAYTSTQNDTGTESYGLVGETGMFYCETVRGGQWSKAIGACFVAGQ